MRLEVGDGDALVRRVDVRHPVREVHARQAALVEDVRVGAAARERRRRLVARRGAGPRRRARRPARRPRTCSRGRSPRSRSRPCSPRCSRRSRSRRASPARGSATVFGSRERASASNEHHSGTMLRAVPPVITPTFALDWWSIRPSRMSAIARAAAKIAERPSSGYMPGVRGAPVEPRRESPSGSARRG